MTPLSRLIIGTVQFGLPYGITNVRGQVSLAEARAILAQAQAAGISLVDTAASYGGSETLLGQCLPANPSMGVITKTLVVSQASIDTEAIEKLKIGVARSCELLGRRSLDALLLHHGSDLLKPGGARLAAFLMAQKASGVARKIGVSVYDAGEIDAVLDIFPPDVIQLPLNIFDQSLIKSGHIRMLRSAGVEIHARSIFLQGVLLTELSRLPVHFQLFKNSFANYSAFLRDTGLTPLQACLGFMIAQSGADRFVVGVTSVDELAAIILAVSSDMHLPAMDGLASADKMLTDPRNWPARSEIEAARS